MPLNASSKESPPMPASWEELLDGMVVYKAHGEIGVNKPLLVLMILARAQRGGENAFHFTEMVDGLTTALRDFGAERQTIHPEYPFWHLQNDGFWLIQDRDDIPITLGATGPTKRALLDADAVGYVLPTMWEQLRKDPRSVPRLAQRVLSRFWPDTSLHPLIAGQLGLNLGDAAG
jgi:putative restriction endonuclease